RGLALLLLHALVLRHRVVRQDIALVYPDLHAAGPVGGARGRDAVVDVGAQRVQRHPAFPVPLHPRDFRAAQAAAAVDADALGAEPHGRLDRPLHGAAECHAALELLRDVLGDQRGVELRLADLDDVEMHLRAGHLGQVAAQLLDVLALLADDHAGPRRMDGDARALGRALDHHPADAGLGQARLKIAPELQVLVQHVGVVVVGVPARVPRPVDAEPKPDGVDLLAHYAFSSAAASSRSRTVIVRLLNGLSTRDARPRARARNRFMTRPFPTWASATNRRSTSSW